MRVRVPHDGDLDSAGEASPDGIPCLAGRREQPAAPVLDAGEASRVDVEAVGGGGLRDRVAVDQHARVQRVVVRDRGEVVRDADPISVSARRRGERDVVGCLDVQ